ncbi:EamA family transporter [[Acidovorax] ebreus]|uniref:EamA family transporter n=1 Tax=Diaphorobacter sp. LI3 TaxID=2952886 RepID=UPI00205F0244|nr:EamA family transporter [Diaphorobacter sp. LI3]
MNSRTNFGWVDFGAAFGVVLIWGLNFVAMKYALQALTPFQLGAARYVVASLPLIFLVRRPSVHWKWLLFYGLCQGVGQFGLLFIALKIGMTAALASVLMQTQVFYTVIFSFLFLHERPGRNLQFGLVLAALSLLCFGIGVMRDTVGGVTAAGLVLNLGAACMWAVSNIVVRKALQSIPKGQANDATAFVIWSSVVPIVPFCILSLLMDPSLQVYTLRHASWQSWVAVLYLGWFATIISYAMWSGLLKRHTANRVAPLSLGVPVIGLAAGVIVLGEVITPWQWAGASLTILALLFIFRPEPARPEAIKGLAAVKE